MMTLLGIVISTTFSITFLSEMCTSHTRNIARSLLATTALYIMHREVDSTDSYFPNCIGRAPLIKKNETAFVVCVSLRTMHQRSAQRCGVIIRRIRGMHTAHAAQLSTSHHLTSPPAHRRVLRPPYPHAVRDSSSNEQKQ